MPENHINHIHRFLTSWCIVAHHNTMKGDDVQHSWDLAGIKFKRKYWNLDMANVIGRRRFGSRARKGGKRGRQNIETLSWWRSGESRGEGGSRAKTSVVIWQQTQERDEESARTFIFHILQIYIRECQWEVLSQMNCFFTKTIHKCLVLELTEKRCS